MKEDLIALVIVGTFFLVVIGGWVANIIKLVSMDAVTGMLIARAVGIVIAPLGVVLGFV